MNLFKSGRREVIWTKLKTLVEKRRILTQVILSSSIGKELCISIAGGEEEGVRDSITWIESCSGTIDLFNIEVKEGQQRPA